MYLPSELNLTSDMLDVISVKKLLFDGSVTSSKTLAWESQSAFSLMSASLMAPLDDEYMNKLQLCGWKSALVITSVSSSMLAGLMSTMLKL
ncbi:hypothetical protein WICPIJ_009171 [Wickerhamomyces pijperi]|uniref:Uncharacterized protein n=1 Tax=Wickerhamomyces pijperi TaxID=599730 RepID=A0A9P8PQ89_WICPI|nr:hypothetical protein WICPIJ_009171 [Wickerhamomyces pijperi]